MIQAFGLTSNPRKELPLAVDDVSFEARAGCVTTLLGTPGAGKTAVLRLMLELQQGRGIAYFRGRPLHRIAHPSREVGVLLGDVPGHPARTVRGQLRMLCAAAGVPVRRADEVLEVVGLVSLREERLGTLSRGMDRRLGLACALLADPHTLVLDALTDGLSAGESRWLHGMLRAHATQGGTVLFTTTDPKEAARTADRIITLDQGRLVADQDAADFSRTRLRPRVAVHSPHATRLAALLTKEARTGQRSVEVVRESGNRLSVYGSTCADIGETAFRHAILVHQLADEVGDMGPGAGAPNSPSEPSPCTSTTASTDVTPPTRPPESNATVGYVPGKHVRLRAGSRARPGNVRARPPALLRCPRLRQPAPASAPHLRPPRSESPAPPPLRAAPGWRCRHRVSDRGRRARVVRPRRRTAGSHRPHPAASSAGRLATGTAAAARGTRRRAARGHRLRRRVPPPRPGSRSRHRAPPAGLLAAKLLVAAATGLVLAFLTVGCDAEVLYLVYGRELAQVPADWLALTARWIGLVIGCAWAGVLAAGVFRSTTAGLAAVVAVPVLVVPLVQKVLEGSSVRSAAGFSVRLRELFLAQWPFGGERYLSGVARMVAQPVGGALTLSLAALLCAYVLTTLRSRVR